MKVSIISSTIACFILAFSHALNTYSMLFYVAYAMHGDAQAYSSYESWGTVPTFNIALAHGMQRDVVMLKRILNSHTERGGERVQVEVARQPLSVNLRGSIVSIQNIVCEEDDIWKFVRRDSVFIYYNGVNHFKALVDETCDIAGEAPKLLHLLSRINAHRGEQGQHAMS